MEPIVLKEFQKVRRPKVSDKLIITFYASVKQHNVVFNSGCRAVIDAAFPKSRVGGFKIYNEGEALVFYMYFVSEEDITENVFKLSQITTSIKKVKYDTLWYQSFLGIYYKSANFYVTSSFKITPEVIVRDKKLLFKIDLRAYKENNLKKFKG